MCCCESELEKKTDLGITHTHTSGSGLLPFNVVHTLYNALLSQMNAVYVAHYYYCVGSARLRVARRRVPAGRSHSVALV